jgi:DNA polymerase-3 subunit epsilon
LLSAVVHPALEDHNLEAIARRLGINVIARHTATGDALATAEILLKLLPLLAGKKIYTLKEAIEASRKSYYARKEY